MLDYFQALQEYFTLYYVTEDSIERGKVVAINETEYAPRFFVCHPDDLEETTRGLGGITVRPLSEYRGKHKVRF